jgi:hypothetical protein
MPNVTGMTDTLDFVKNLWGNMNVPGVNMTGPSLSTDELDKKIADLKAVEAWLNLNATMLHATIQAMEVQRGTIATLKSMGESLAQAMRQPGADDKAGAAAAAASPFAAFFSAPAAAPVAGSGAAAPSRQPDAAAQPAPALPPAAAAMPAALAWWNLLQDQFQQAVASAVSPEAMAGAAAMAQDAAARFGMPTPADASKSPDAAGEKPGSPEPAGSNAAKARAAKPKADKS